MPKHQFVSLNDNDLISIGGNNTENEALGNKNVFLYQIKAPSRWDCGNIPEDENEGIARNIFKINQNKKETENFSLNSKQ